ncbi:MULTISPECIES: YbfB/YjiJ family MFS transporter [Lysinibacillus]|uniref:YbfB/YjiJ family MFS transporter n=1 Tax=Lysinibacillus capsici TaxID=2115968 RepID=A0ABY8KJQ4_9BACI|nr:MULTISPECIES: YbfB/YjiJ family MFS transporter [Lysinibacillus]KMN40760.1 MFS transporter [Lysinibacillus sp. LK3]MCT1539844.1 YbfB/YjiJ family MFS transporter [Lysinibacillus capsici]MCT1570914.1 YbfB/YjiJ family MFS transporter [Lysinibacillus capsici]MCT1648317.1 YbfB/YjiJ family MFS transporter [Lysinibacillus capsici]MCT1726859.1 YbfB/YjiJ family MFS transporter [Lysinibacillus capsici]
MHKQTVRYLIGGIFALVIAMGIGRFSYTVILPYMQETFEFSRATAGYLATSNYLGYLVGAWVAGRLPIGNKRILFLQITLGISILTTAFMGFTNVIIIWYLLRFISGVVSAFIFVVITSLILDQLASSSHMHLSGLFYSGVGIGIALSAVIVSPIQAVFHWNGTWIVLALFSIVLFVLIVLFIKPITPSKQLVESQIISQKTPPQSWMKWLIIAYSLEGLGYIVTGTFIVSIAQESTSFHGDAAFVWFVVGVAAIPSCIVWSKLAQRYGYVKILLISMLLQAIGIVLPALATNSMTLYASAFIFGATFMGITTVCTTLARKLAPVNSHQMIGYLTAGYALGQMIGPSIAGTLASYTNSYQYALVGASLVVMLGGLCLIGGVKYDRSN